MSWLLFGNTWLLSCKYQNRIIPDQVIFVKILVLKKCVLAFTFIFICFFNTVQKSSAQCSICTKTAQQLGEKPAKGMNAGILYLAAAPFLIAGYVYYRWRKNNRSV
jgi:hypothetical protein